MIERYSLPEMKNIWSEEEKYKRWLIIEKAVNDSLQFHSIIPKNELSKIIEEILNSNGTFNTVIGRAKDLEKDIGHDVVSFIFAIEDYAYSYHRSEDGRWIHYGMTSSDLLDTSNAMAIKESKNVILDEMRELHDSLNKYHTEKETIIGRTHGMYAEPIPLREIFKNFQKLLINHIHHLSDTKVMGKISGAVGDNKYIPVPVAFDVLHDFGIGMSNYVSQIVPRDYYAELVSRLSLIACTLETMVLQIRLYQQSGIEEMYEPFGKKQTGSSAMPHKRNPILCENITGLSRLMRSYVIAAMENVALWHQRDISHSSVERVILPDSFNVLYYMLKRVRYIFENLEINYGAISDHLWYNFDEKDSQKKMLDLIKEGKGRQEAYRIVQQEHKK